MTAPSKHKLTPKQRVLRKRHGAFSYRNNGIWKINSGYFAEILGEAVDVRTAWRLAAMRLDL